MEQQPAQPNKSLKLALPPGLIHWLDMATHWLASSMVRILIMTFAIAIVAYLLYTNVWRPLMADVMLPPGISTANIKLDTDLLKSINDQSVGRIGHRVEPLNFNAIFQADSGQ